MIQPFFSLQGVTKCQNIETILSLMAIVMGISEHMLTSWSSLYLLLCFTEPNSTGASAFENIVFVLYTINKIAFSSFISMTCKIIQRAKALSVSMDQVNMIDGQGI